VDAVSKGSAPVVFGDGRQTRDFIHVRDVAAANALAATKPLIRSNSYNIGRGEETSLLQILEVIKEQNPSTAPFEYRPFRRGDIVRSVSSPRRFCDETGFRPAISIPVGLQEMCKSSARAVGP
jgi:nucleoside-diphosphate-sugar epimerase